MPRAKKIKISKNSPSILASKREPMTKFKFVMAVLQGTVAALTFTLIFTIYAAIIFFGHIKKINIAKTPYQNNSIDLLLNNNPPEHITPYGFWNYRLLAR